MPGILRFSDATSLAFHAAVFLGAQHEEPQSVSYIAWLLGCSEAHLSKVMQRLAKAGLVVSTRGPKGGYRLAREPQEVTLLEIFEAVEGPLVSSQCLFGKAICQGPCMLGDLLSIVNVQVRDYLSNTRLADVTGIYARLSEKQAARSEAT